MIVKIITIKTMKTIKNKMKNNNNVDSDNDNDNES